MPKVLELLEAYVEWVAISLGGLFVILMLWLYVLTPAAQVEVGGAPRTPGEVDAFIRSGPARDLEEAIGSNKVPEMPVPEFTEAFQKNMAREGEPTIAWDFPPMFKVRQLTEAGGGEGPTPNTPQIVAKPVKALPVPPVPVMAGANSGLSNVMVPDPGQVRDPNNPAQLVNLPRDVQWVTVEADIDSQELAKEFARQGIPQQIANANNTLFLSVELSRREVRAGGDEGPEVIVKPLQIHEFPEFPRKDDRQAIAVYEDWASRNSKVILQPAFYEWKAGDKWMLPTEAQNAEVQPAVDTAAPSPVTPKNMTAAERKARRDAEAAEKKAAAQRRAEEKQRAIEEKRMRQQQGGPGGPRPPNYAPKGPTMPFQPPPEFNGERLPPFMGGANASPATPGEIPAGMFDPRQYRSITIWAHDESAIPGKTYRYRIRYAIRSPVFKSNLVANPALAQEYALFSDWSEPTDSVTVPSRTSYFVNSGVRPGRDVVSFEVFTRYEGRTISKVFEVGPGDAIGGVDGEISYMTGWTVVDFRRDLRNSDETYFLLVDDEGNLDRRDFRTDQGKSEYRDLKGERDADNVAQGQATR